MILSDLYEYYESKPKANPCARDTGFDEMCPRFWTVKNVGWEIAITPEGEYASCTPLVGPKPKGGLPKLLPDISRTSGVCALVFADKAQYILGGDAKRDTEARRDFVAKQHAVLDGIEDEAARAFLAFIDKNPLDNGIPEDVRKRLGEDASLIAFRLDSDPQWREIQNRPAIAAAWEHYAAFSGDHGAEGMCLVTGVRQPVARLFPQVTGVPEANTSGASLVSFNQAAFCSYGHDEASISEDAAYKCGEALRYLLKSDSHRTLVGRDSVVFWTEEDRESDLGFVGLDLGMDDMFAKFKEDPDTLNAIKRQLELIRSGRPLPDVDLDERYHILGIAPYQARLAVRFYEEGTLGELQESLASFLRDTAMVNVRPCSMKGYLEQVAPLGDRKNIPAPLITSCMRALIEGLPFPDALFGQLLARMRADHGARNPWDMGRRAAMMRAYLVRRERLTSASGQDYERSLPMALNKDNTHIGYLLGRLFAVLEKLQVEAIAGGKASNINATIRDRYMGSAATSPALVFPQLLKLAQHHIGKSSYGIRRDREICEIVGLMPDEGSFPATLSSSQQGEFYIGYYQQKQELYTSSRSGDGQSADDEGIDEQADEQAAGQEE